MVEVSQAWKRYERLKPKKVDPSAAAFAALAYGALQDYDKAVAIQESALKSRPSPNGYFQLADFAYRADQVEKGDAAAKEAVQRSPSDQRNTVRSLIKDLKKQGKQIAKAVDEAKKAQREQAKQGKDQPAGQSFGPLPGSGGAAPSPTP